MKQMMTYHNIRNMIHQLPYSGSSSYEAYCTDRNSYNPNENTEIVTFNYSENLQIGIEQILCMMSHYENSYEILISVREIKYSNSGLQERNLVYIKLRSKDPYEVIEVTDHTNYSELYISKKLIQHKATRRLVNRIYNRLMLPKIYEIAAGCIRKELEHRYTSMEETDNEK